VDLPSVSIVSEYIIRFPHCKQETLIALRQCSWHCRSNASHLDAEIGQSFPETAMQRNPPVSMVME
jgi:hypothetical protein